MTAHNVSSLNQIGSKAEKSSAVMDRAYRGMSGIETPVSILAAAGFLPNDVVIEIPQPRCRCGQRQLGHSASALAACSREGALQGCAQLCRIRSNHGTSCNAPNSLAHIANVR